MDKDNAEYVVRDFSPVDRHVDELARRERILTWRLFIDNLKETIVELQMRIGFRKHFLSIVYEFFTPCMKENIIIQITGYRGKMDFNLYKSVIDINTLISFNSEIKLDSFFFIFKSAFFINR